ncbi:inactive dipeptidyl peptidase 10 isoform X2 [Polyodon spathula]|uniref:inactive dipeptidyl peptidase 10 isoform X2 n=1 Tax=Polyodon spathula TaxID=7913 RepID=UPI001B7F5C75|nr:inactive dipeptidyl peptidase 10 isoform X2 [Polyodon spathula]
MMIATTQQNMSRELDLGESSRPPRNWKGICIAVVVIVVVMSLVILSIILLTPESRLSLQSPFSLEDLMREEFKVHDPAVTWVSESEVTLRTREGHVIKRNVKTNESTTLVENSTFLTLKASQFQVSPDLRFVLLAYNVQPMHSQSFSASYAIYSVETREVSELNPPEVKRSVLQFAAWGSHGNQLVYVFENNIYYQPDVSSSAQRLVSTGKEGVLLNGVSDWLYEEEVLHSYAAHWWSGDGARLAYLTINNSATPNMEIPHFLGGAYPSSTHYPYPKAGQPIPTVRLFVVNLYGLAHTLELIPPDSFRTRECYLPMVKWLSSTRLAVRWLTRPQSQSALTICEATTGACLEKHRIASDAWISKPQEEPLFSQDGSSFFLTLPVKQGARGEFQHIALLSTQATAPTTPSRFLTSGNWDVTSLCALDERRGKIYFLSTENSPRSRHLYSLCASVHSVDVAGVFRRTCVTCDLIADCTFFKAPQFSPDMTSFTLQCGGPGVPKVSVHQTDDPSNYFILEDNEALEEALRGKRLPVTEFRTIPADGYDLQLKLSLPVGYKDRVRPLVIVVDGTPGSQSVTEQFALDWGSVLSSSLGAVLARLDGRGSGNQGQKLQQAVRQKLGSAEVKDHLRAVEWLVQQPYIDRTRIALYGKAYGGYLTLKMLAATDGQFKCAAAFAPITDFSLYDAAFSERYLGLPSKEYGLYTAASLLGEAHRLRGERFLLIHGTADATVHFQHTAELLHSLVTVDANYTLQIHPDEGHTLQSDRSRQHLIRTLVRYFLGCLQNPRGRSSERQEEEY